MGRRLPGWAVVAQIGDGGEDCNVAARGMAEPLASPGGAG